MNHVPRFKAMKSACFLPTVFSGFSGLLLQNIYWKLGLFYFSLAVCFLSHGCYIILRQVALVKIQLSKQACVFLQNTNCRW